MLVRRRDWATLRLERRHYHAEYFGYSWHMDLTCKLAAYGIYLGFIIDGDSRMVIHATVMPDKSAPRVYEELLRPALSLWAFPDQLVTDQGEEWRLCIFVCFFVWWVTGRATPTGRIPHKVVPSTANVCNPQVEPSPSPSPCPDGSTQQQPQPQLRPQLRSRGPCRRMRSPSPSPSRPAIERPPPPPPPCRGAATRRALQL